MRVQPNTASFVSTKGYNIKNPTLNFEDTFVIKKTFEKPIGKDEVLHAIRFDSLENKSYYWYYPNLELREADYLTLESIQEFLSQGGGGTQIDYNAIPTNSGFITGDVFFEDFGNEHGGALLGYKAPNNLKLLITGISIQVLDSNQPCAFALLINPSLAGGGDLNYETGVFNGLIRGYPDTGSPTESIIDDPGIPKYVNYILRGERGFNNPINPIFVNMNQNDELILAFRVMQGNCAAAGALQYKIIP